MDDPQGDGLKVAWYCDTAVKVPPICCCCLAPMEKALDVWLLGGDLDEPKWVPLPMPYCGACWHRAWTWNESKKQGSYKAFALLAGPALVIGLILVAFVSEILAAIVLGTGLIFAIFYGGIWFAKRSHQLPAKVDGHTDYCEAVTSFPQGGFIRDGRAGGVLLFANPRFGAQWAALNGVVPG